MQTLTHYTIIIFYLSFLLIIYIYNNNYYNQGWQKAERAEPRVDLLGSVAF